MAKTGRLFCAGGSNLSFLFSGYQYRVFEPSTQRSCCCTFKSFNTMHFVITHRMDDVFYAMQLFFLLHLSSSHTIHSFTLFLNICVSLSIFFKFQCRLVALLWSLISLDNEKKNRQIIFFIGCFYKSLATPQNYLCLHLVLF